MTAGPAQMSAFAAAEAFLQDEMALEQHCPVGLSTGVPGGRLVAMARDEVGRCREEEDAVIKRICHFEIPDQWSHVLAYGQRL